VWTPGSSERRAIVSSSSLKLPERPSLDYLKNQAYDLQRQAQADGRPLALSEAYHALARRYGFASWPRLKAQVEFLNNTDLVAIVNAIKADDTPEVVRLLALHRELLNARGPNEYSFLHYACRKSIGMLGALLDAGLPIDTPLPRVKPCCISRRHFRKPTGLFFCWVGERRLRWKLAAIAGTAGRRWFMRCSTVAPPMRRYWPNES
jgi:hypothetical protein